MRQSLMLEFPLNEYETRITALRELMAEQMIDAVVLTTEENTRYFCGFRMIVWDSKISKPGALVLPLEGTPVLVTSTGGYETAVATSCCDDVRTWHPQGTGARPKTFPMAIADALRSMHAQNGRVGFETGSGMRLHLTAEDREQLFSSLDQAVICGPCVR